MEPLSGESTASTDTEDMESGQNLIRSLRQAFFQFTGNYLNIGQAAFIGPAAMANAGYEWGPVTPTLIAMVVQADEEMLAFGPSRLFHGFPDITPEIIAQFQYVLELYRAHIGGESPSSSSGSDTESESDQATSITISLGSDNGGSGVFELVSDDENLVGPWEYPVTRLNFDEIDTDENEENVAPIRDMSPEV